MIGYTIRDAEPGDLNFIMATWKRSFHSGSQLSIIPDWRFYQTVNAPINALAQTTKCVVCCDNENPAYVLAWVCFDDSAVHYVFVRGGARGDNYRGLGIATKLLEIAKAHGKPCTHTTALGEPLRLKFNMRHEPHLVYGDQKNVSTRPTQRPVVFTSNPGSPAGHNNGVRPAGR